MNIRLPSLPALLALLLGSFAHPAVAAPSDACGALTAAMAAAAPGPVLLPSFPTVTATTSDLQALAGTAFLYDNAVAAIALIGCGDVAAARRIGDAIVYAQDHDRFWHDGRLRNGYVAGGVPGGPMKLTGWWDTKTQSWFEDRYQAGSDSGNLAWAMLALLALDQALPGEPAYRAAALRLGDWLERFADTAADTDNPGADNPGGYRGGTFGHEPSPELVGWKSTEHNTDLAAAYDRLADQTGTARWRLAAATAHRLVTALWGPVSGCYATGTGDDGVTPNDFVALDAQVWPLLALPTTAKHRAAVLQHCLPTLRQGDGYAYSAVLQGIWTEGTAQVALLLTLTGDAAGAAKLLETIAKLRAPGGFCYAADRASLPTGFELATAPGKPRLYFHLPHLGATAWAALAERGFNPFTAASRLP